MNGTINTSTKTCGLIGYPIGHSVSPLIHNSLAEIYGQNLVYVPLQTQPGKLSAAIAGADAFDFLGMNVTIPYKQEVIPLLKEIDPLARQIGAVNTLVRIPGGYKGYNTDMPGLYRAMCSDNIKVEEEEVILLGAGGVARAVAFLLHEKKAKHIYLLNRSFEKAKNIADELNLLEKGIVTPLLLSDFAAIPDGKYLTIQATNVGMYPQTEHAVIEDPAFYSKVKIAYDIIFNPLHTTFMKMAEKAGAKAYNGLKMLLYQGIIAYEYWNQIQVREEDASWIYQRMRETLRPIKKDNLILIGFMGSGKTTIGRELAFRTGREFCDTDQEIEKTEGRSILEMFEQDGETYFREKETEILKKMVRDSSFSGKVISVGGGTPLKEENRTLLRQLGQVIYLQVSPETVYARLRGDKSRPLLQGEDPQKNIRELMQKRSCLYEKAADHILPVDRMSPAEAVQYIEMRRTEKK